MLRMKVTLMSLNSIPKLEDGICKIALPVFCILVESPASGILNYITPNYIHQNQKHQNNKDDQM